MTKSLDIDLSLGLTSDQSQAIKTFSSWLEDPSLGKPFVLSGHAGSGKTFLAMRFLQLVDTKDFCWTVAAPTHKAVGVLRKALDKEGLTPTWFPSTIHRLLRLKLKRKGDKEFCEETKQTASSLEKLALVIVDEASMIDKALLEIVLKCAYSSKTRLVFVGDPAQLPPIGEAQGAVFGMQRIIQSKLNEIVRHQGPVLRLASRIRDGSFPCEVPPCFPPLRSSTGLVCSLDKGDWLKNAKESLKAASQNNDPDQARILCYTNRVLETLIPHARRAIHGDMADQLPVLPGEVLITRKPILANASVDAMDVGEEPDMLISSNREMIVIDVAPETCDFSEFGTLIQSEWSPPCIETLVAKVLCGEKEFSLRLSPQVGTSSRKTLDIFLNNLSTLAKESSNFQRKQFWRAFFFVRDSFASVGPASVLTVHRSQGSTFENVFIASDVFWPIDLCLRKQLVYVAVTRASKQVWLVGNPKKELISDFCL